MESVIEIYNRNGLKLNGILHSPTGKTKDIGILFLHAGVQGRHGNTNQYVLYAREFCNMGFSCLRYDPYGLGDSEGLIEPMEMRDFYGSIQSGRYVEDAIDAIDYFKKLGFKKIILFGLCGGAITAHLAAALTKNVVGAILLSVPVLLDSSKYSHNYIIPKQIAIDSLKVYLRKIFGIKYWIRFMTFKTEYRSIINYIKSIVVGIKPKKKNDDKKNDQSGNLLLNKSFFEAYKNNKEKIRTLFLFGTNDNFWFHFKSEFYEQGLLDERDKLLLVEKANHMFTLMEWQKQVIGNTKLWLEAEKFI